MGYYDFEQAAMVKSVDTLLLGSRLYDSSKKGIITTFVCITGLLVTRWIYSRHLPLSDLYESFIFLSWSLSIIHMVPYLKKHKNHLSAITAPIVILTQGFATSGFLTEMHQSRILVPALQSHWLMMHVSMMVLGYAALLCGSLLSVALIVITFRKIIRTFDKSNNESFSFDEIQYINELGLSGEQQMGYSFHGGSVNYWAELDLNQRRHIANEFTVRPH
ncbi:hypothetical protein ACB092_09G177300 [Castanea dentata]